MAPSTPNRPRAYPEPLRIPPSSGIHKSTIIILHGRGSNGLKFGPPLLSTPFPGPSEPSSISEASSDFTTLTSSFPDTRFVFPTARTTRATIYARSRIPQWFDNWHLDQPGEREELMTEGLGESVDFIHGLLRQEIAAVGAQNVALGGLSQGCATSMVSLLLWEGEALAAGFGMCGWLPYAERIGGMARGERRGWDEDGEKLVGEETGNPFGDDDGNDESDDGSAMNNGARAITALREGLDLKPPEQDEVYTIKTPLYLAHGMQDDRVSFTSGKEMARCMEDLGFQITWKEYGELGHWYCSDMLHELCKFLERAGL